VRYSFPAPRATSIGAAFLGGLRWPLTRCATMQCGRACTAAAIPEPWGHVVGRPVTRSDPPLIARTVRAARRLTAPRGVQHVQNAVAFEPLLFSHWASALVAPKRGGPAESGGCSTKPHDQRASISISRQAGPANAHHAAWAAVSRTRSAGAIGSARAPRRGGEPMGPHGQIGRASGRDRVY
jgi:hypothetical protein